MYAVIRVNWFDPRKLADSREMLEEFDELHASQPGFLGSIVVDLGEGRRVALNLWESEEHSKAALSVLGPQVGRLLNPLMVEPSQLIGVGAVIHEDVLRSPDRSARTPPPPPR